MEKGQIYRHTYGKAGVGWAVLAQMEWPVEQQPRTSAYVFCTAWGTEVS